MTKTKLIIKRFTMILDMDICAMLWQAYEHDIVTILNEDEFIDIFDMLTNNYGYKCFADITLMYPENGDFENLFINEYKKEYFICEHYKD